MVSIRILLVLVACCGLLPATSAQNRKSSHRKKQQATYALPIIKRDREVEDDSSPMPQLPPSGSFKIYRGHNSNTPTAIPVEYELRWSQPYMEWSDSLSIQLHAARPCVAGIRILYRDTIVLRWMAANQEKVHEHTFYLGKLPYSRVYNIQFLAAWGEVMEERSFRRDYPPEAAERD